MSKTPAQRTPSAKRAAKTLVVPGTKKTVAPATKAPAKAAAKTAATGATGSKAAAREPANTKTPASSKTVTTPQRPAKTAASTIASKTAPSAPAKAPARKSEAQAVAAAPAAAPVSPAPAAPEAARPIARPSMNKTTSQAVLEERRPSPAKVDPRIANAWKTKSGRELTDEEVLAMPESEYMNDKQLEFFRAKLEKLKEDLLSNAGETTEHLREDTTIVPDPADRATIEEEHALELRTRDRERKLLKKISQALARIDSGEYGFCEETGEPIGLGRLIARPTATLSLEAQQRRELKQKLFGD